MSSDDMYVDMYVALSASTCLERLFKSCWSTWPKLGISLYPSREGEGERAAVLRFSPAALHQPRITKRGGTQHEICRHHRRVHRHRLASAKLLLDRGFRVFGQRAQTADADRLKSEFGANFTPLIFDVTDEAAVLAAAREVRDALKGETLAGLVNNAGIAVAGPVLELAADEFRRQMDVNVIGPDHRDPRLSVRCSAAIRS